MSNTNQAGQFDNSLDVHVKAKGVTLGGSKSQSFNGAPVALTQLLNNGFSGPLRLQIRINPEEAINMIAGLVGDGNGGGLKDTDLVQRNGLKLDIHLGARTSQQTGGVFDASFFYLKPVQDRNTGGQTQRIQNAVGGDASIPSPGSFSGESSEG